VSVILKNIVFGGVSLSVRFVSTMLMFIIIARSFGVETFGMFTYAVTLCTVFLALIDYGYNLYIVKEISASPHVTVQLADSALTGKVVLTLAATIGVALTMLVQAPAREVALLVPIVWLGTIAYSFGYFFNMLFRAQNRFNFEAYPTLLFSVTQLLLVAIACWMGYGIEIVGGAYLVARLLYVMVSYVLVRKHIGGILPRVRIAEALHSIRGTFSYGFHSIVAVVFFQVDTLILSWYRGDTEVGYYQAPMRLITACMIVYDVVVSGFLPVISRSFKENRPEFIRRGVALQKYMTVLGCLLGCGLFFYRQELIRIVYGASFEPSIAILEALAVVIALRFLSASYGLFITISDNQAQRSIAVGAALLLNVGLNLWFIPLYGAMGAAIASIISHLALFAVYYVLSFRLLAASFIDRTTVRTLALMGVTLVAFMFLRLLAPAVSEVGFVIAFIVIALSSLNVEERALLRGRFSRFRLGRT
jgi:O-antigen/teichoic acid export membrane protein